MLLMARAVSRPADNDYNISHLFPKVMCNWFWVAFYVLVSLHSFDTTCVYRVTVFSLHTMSALITVFERLGLVLASSRS